MKSRIALSSLVALSLLSVPALAKKANSNRLGGTTRVEARISFDAASEEAIVEAVNAERARAGLGPLAIDPRLREAARGHSKDMGDLGFFDHVSPVKGKTQFTDRLRAEGVSKFGAAGENIAEGPFSASSRAGSFMKLWMESEGHRENILSPEFHYIGVGVYVTEGGDVYATQEFTRLGSEEAAPAAPIEVGGEAGIDIDLGPEVLGGAEATPEVAPEAPVPAPEVRRGRPPQSDVDSDEDGDEAVAPSEASEGSRGVSEADRAKIYGLMGELSSDDSDDDGDAGVTIIVNPSQDSYYYGSTQTYVTPRYYAPAPRYYSTPRYYSAPRYYSTSRHHSCH